jgi:hypothetical protein
MGQYVGGARIAIFSENTGGVFAGISLGRILNSGFLYEIMSAEIDGAEIFELSHYPSSTSGLPSYQASL